MVKEQGRKLVAQNRKARYDYHIDDTLEAGLVLVGTEVKSLRAGRATLVDGFAEVEGGEAYLHGVHIPEYTQGTWTNHEPRRVRKLLLHRAEIDAGEAWLHNVHIPEYTQGTWTNHSARRRRKMLLNRSEIDKIERKLTDKGYTVVPLSLYFKDGYAKVEIAVATGKKDWDKRHDLAERDAKREAERALASRNRYRR